MKPQPRRFLSALIFAALISFSDRVEAYLTTDDLDEPKIGGEPLLSGDELIAAVVDRCWTTDDLDHIRPPAPHISNAASPADLDVLLPPSSWQKSNIETELQRETSFLSRFANSLPPVNFGSYNYIKGSGNALASFPEEASIGQSPVLHDEFSAIHDIDPENQKVFDLINDYLSDLANQDSDFLSDDFFSLCIHDGKLALSVQGKNYSILPRDGEFEIISQNNVHTLKFGNSYADFKTGLNEFSEYVSIRIKKGQITLTIGPSNFNFPIRDGIISLNITNDTNTLWVGNHFWTRWGDKVDISKNMDEVRAGIILSMSQFNMAQSRIFEPLV